MALEILKYVVVHDCGTVINPLILAGQIHGGVAQGIGNAFYEKLVFDDEGQLLNASLADYLLPTALEVPRMELAHTVTPSPLNPLGIKGAGEAGAIPVGPLFAQAIEDALGLLPPRSRTQRNSAQPRPAVGADAKSKCGDAMILVTGAAGKTGKAVIERRIGGQGRSACAPWCAAPHTRRCSKRSAPPKSASAGFDDAAALAQAAARRASAIYHICPNVSPHEVAYARASSPRRSAHGVRRFVYHSVLHPQIEAMPHHWAEDAGRGDAVCRGFRPDGAAADGLHAEHPGALASDRRARRLPRALSGRDTD